MSIIQQQNKDNRRSSQHKGYLFDSFLTSSVMPFSFPVPNENTRRWLLNQQKITIKISSHVQNINKMEVHNYTTTDRTIHM